MKAELKGFAGGWSIGCREREKERTSTGQGFILSTWRSEQFFTTVESAEQQSQRGRRGLSGGRLVWTRQMPTQ